MSKLVNICANFDIDLVTIHLHPISSSHLTNISILFSKKVILSKLLMVDLSEKIYVADLNFKLPESLNIPISMKIGTTYHINSKMHLYIFVKTFFFELSKKNLVKYPLL